MHNRKSTEINSKTDLSNRPHHHQDNHRNNPHSISKKSHTENSSGATSFTMADSVEVGKVKRYIASGNNFEVNSTNNKKIKKKVSYFCLIKVLIIS